MVFSPGVCGFSALMMEHFYSSAVELFLRTSFRFHSSKKFASKKFAPKDFAPKDFADEVPKSYAVDAS